MVNVWFCAVLLLPLLGKQGVAASSRDLERADIEFVRVDEQGFNLRIFAPTSNGTFPVIFFVSGFGGDVPSDLYSDLLGRIVENGYVVVGMDQLRIPNYPQSGKDLAVVLAWAAEGGLLAKMRGQGLAATPDVHDRAAVMGQSAGNHVVGQALVDNCSIAKAAVFLDPVDGVDPYRFVKTEDLISPGHLLNFSLPVLLLDNGLDDKHNFLLPPCMPPAMGTARWEAALRGPYWRINATAYGHTDCLDRFDSTLGKLVCPSSSETDKDAYRAMIAGAVADFLGGLFGPAPERFASLEDARGFSVDVVLNRDLKGLSHAQILPGCVNPDAPATVPLVV